MMSSCFGNIARPCSSTSSSLLVLVLVLKLKPNDDDVTSGALSALLHLPVRHVPGPIEQQQLLSCRRRLDQVNDGFRASSS
ncbi:unnamed protein product [Heligmosomoides polygyrus]|uniref:Secreted protein n=1 Tax=Heligmosomoides polygyrus TaxID=6339 RepID=A0A183FM60_HELPZ|nr:unnamed protein product [Heligmosomoides polygyrus]